MTAAGNGCTVESTPGASHGFFNKTPHLEQTLEKMDTFLTELGYLPKRSH
jgi:hypothetical protein